MRKRLFLVVLVLFLLLVTMTNQHLQNPAALLGGGKVLGSIPLWQLYNTLPAGIFAAGACAVALGIGAELWLALLPLCGARWTPKEPLNRLADAGLWCGWVTLAACATALACVFPWAANAPGDAGGSCTSFFGLQHYRLVLMIGGGAMILSRLLAAWLREHAALPIVVLASGTALACGQFWCRALPISHLGIALLLPWAVLLLWQPGRLSRPQFYTTLAATAIALYSQAFPHTISSYVLRLPEPDSLFPAAHTTFNTLLLLGVLLLSLSLRPLGLLHRERILRGVGALLLFCCLRSLWYLVAAGAVGTQLETFFHLSVGCYVVVLVCVSGLVALRLWATAPQKKAEKQEN